MMEKQNLIIKEMTEKKHSFDEIKQTLHQKFGESAYKDSTIYEKMRLVRCNQNITERKQYESDRIDLYLDQIMNPNLFHKFPFASVRMIALDVKRPPVTVYRYLTQALHLKYKHTHWLPHKLSYQNLKDRAQKSNELFDILKISKCYDYRNIITGDQSWILYQYNPHGKWCLDTEENPEFEKDKINNQKFMIIIIWGVCRFFVVNMLP